MPVRWLEALAALWRSWTAPAVPESVPGSHTLRAAELLASALGEDDPHRRVTLLRAALSAGERLAGEAGDVVVMEASLHLGEKLRALGSRDEAVEHFARAVERSFRVSDPIGRQRRAGVLTRLGILDQEARRRAGAAALRGVAAARGRRRFVPAARHADAGGVQPRAARE